MPLADCLGKMASQYLGTHSLGKVLFSLNTHTPLPSFSDAELSVRLRGFNPKIPRRNSNPVECKGLEFYH